MGYGKIKNGMNLMGGASLVHLQVPWTNRLCQEHARCGQDKCGFEISRGEGT